MIRNLIILACLLENFCTTSGFEFWPSIFPYASSLIFSREEISDFNKKEYADTTPKFDQEYDFVVVGAGSAGATIAARLSEIKDFTVLLIEAGGPEELYMDIPLGVSYLQYFGSADIDWKYQTESSDNYCLGMEDHKCRFPRGKVMGGSSVLNYMIATRGDPRDYDGWAQMGNDGWSYSEVLEYFKKLEAMEIEELKANDRLHSANGSIPINYPPYHTKLAEGFLEAGKEMKYPLIDYNGNQSVGFSYIQATMKNGERMSTNRAYLHSIDLRDNLHVTKKSHVNKILINPDTKIAYGVDFTKNYKSIRVKAKKEVILAAGAIGSPQILMLSGVGPKKHLEEMEIDVIEDIPVGENLMDHIAYGGLIFLVNQPISIMRSEIINPLNWPLPNYTYRREGPLSVPGGVEAIAFLDVDNPGQLDAYSNLELLFIGATMVSDSSIPKSFGISEEYWKKVYSEIEGSYSYTMFPMIMRPKSRGRISLASKDPKSKPKINPNYLSDADDIRILVQGIRTAINVSKSEALQQFGSELHNATIPGCEEFEYDSDKYWECAVRTFTFNIYHYSGTCKMAPQNDPTGVVDPRLKVKGIKGLRVADASIMPTIITGHTHIPTVMIAEKLADMVKEEWNKNS